MVEGEAAYLAERTRLAKEQSRLAELQSQNLIDQNAFELSHLRWRRFNDQMKGALQIMLVLLGIAILFGIAAAFWRASQADGLVVDGFSAPPVLAQSGITSEVIAQDITNKLNAIRETANENSLARSKDVRQEHGDDIKVEIPDTGVSLSQLWRYLKQWVGNERHLNGNLRHMPDGKLALTVALDDATAATFTGTDLDALEQKAAEQVFADVDPSQFALYLDITGRSIEALAAAERLTKMDLPQGLHSDAYALWANETRAVLGDPALSMARARMAVQIDPRTAAPHMEMMAVERTLGRDEDLLREAKLIPKFRREDEPAFLGGDGFDYILELGTRTRDAETRDLVGAMADPCSYFCEASSVLLNHAELAARLHDPGLAEKLIGEARAAGGIRPTELTRSLYFLDASKGDWLAAIRDARAYRAALLSSPALGTLHWRQLNVLTHADPLLAIAQANTGVAVSQAPGAPADCYLCLRANGLVRTAQHQWGAAGYWFARAVAIGPSLPFAQTEWGGALLAKGDLPGAVRELTAANAKGPRFADPLEMWGEALVRENRSDLALAKFADADKCAPNWGRLHLKWGEALLWLGRKEDARVQLTQAAGLSLTPAERAELAALRTA
jgi:hypothetical protein